MDAMQKIKSLFTTENRHLQNIRYYIDIEKCINSKYVENDFEIEKTIKSLQYESEIEKNEKWNLFVSKMLTCLKIQLNHCKVDCISHLQDPAERAFFTRPYFHIFEQLFGKGTLKIKKKLTFSDLHLATPNNYMNVIRMT